MRELNRGMTVQPWIRDSQSEAPESETVFCWMQDVSFRSSASHGLKLILVAWRLLFHLFCCPPTAIDVCRRRRGGECSCGCGKEPECLAVGWMVYKVTIAGVSSQGSNINSDLNLISNIKAFFQDNLILSLENACPTSSREASSRGSQER